MNIIHALVQRRLLPQWIQRSVWNREFALGRWNSRILHTPNDPIYDLLARYCTDRDVCDIGSGHGNTICEMKPVYRSYTGVDISDVALRIAAKRASDAGRERVRFVQGFMHSFIPDTKPDVFLFRESLQYISRSQKRIATDATRFLRRYAAMLAPDGIMICRLSTAMPRGKYKASAVETAVRQNFDVIECRRTQEPAFLAVFRPSR